jgi:hypothetical protein
MTVKVAEVNFRHFFFYACEYKVNQTLLRSCITETDKVSYFNRNPNFMKAPSSYSYVSILTQILSEQIFLQDYSVFRLCLLHTILKDMMFQKEDLCPSQGEKVDSHPVCYIY